MKSETLIKIVGLWYTTLTFTDNKNGSGPCDPTIWDDKIENNIFMCTTNKAANLAKSYPVSYNEKQNYYKVHKALF